MIEFNWHSGVEGGGIGERGVSPAPLLLCGVVKPVRGVVVGIVVVTVAGTDKVALPCRLWPANGSV